MGVRWDIDGWATALEAAGRAPGTVKLRRYHVARFAAVHPDPARVGTGDVARWLAGQRSAESRKSWRSSLHGYYMWAIRAGQQLADPTIALLPIRVPRAVPRPCPPVIVRDTIAAAPDDVRLMVMLGAGAGLRRGEIARVHSRDVEGDMLRVCGKGGHTRLVPLDDGLIRALAARGPGWVFPGRWGGHVQPDTVGRKVRRALGAGWHAHNLRHAYATAAYLDASDIRAVQELLGHTSPATTARYVAVSDDAVRSAAAAAARVFLASA